MLEDLSLPVNIGLFVAAAIAVWLAAVRLTRYADEIATRTGVGQEVVGLLLLGGATSLPELAVAATATLQGTPELTINDVLGSAAVNVVLLALADVLIRGKALTSVQSSPKVLLIGVLGITMMALVVAPTVTGDQLLLGIGRWSWIMLLVYIAAVWVMAHSHATDAWRPQQERHGGREDEAGAGDGEAPLSRLGLRAALAAAVILVAGFLLARTGEAIAHGTGLGTNFFGVVVLAFATSLPEASTVIAAVRRGRYEMAISDVLGTNLFNVTIIVLVDALHPGDPVLVEAGRFASFGALLALLLTALFLAGMVERRDRTIGRLGVDSVIALLTYGAGLFVLYALR
jgi:cation:H+ antiporter